MNKNYIIILKYFLMTSKHNSEWFCYKKKQPNDAHEFGRWFTKE